MPVDSLLGNDLEHTTWTEVELRSHLEMLPRNGVTGAWSLEQCPRQLHRGRARGCGNPAPPVHVVVDVAPEEEAPEPTGEDIAALGNLPELASSRVEGESTREEFCQEQKECPTLDGPTVNRPQPKKQVKPLAITTYIGRIISTMSLR
ncbi:hypothetical protein NDU88_000287 [Pleurodeles waltl]|uniref:Uncharacterized protein n=1 Tax=Pleurodeles waltl TaxID=8319 RepID=A0AAV7TFB7_PLEWA|nr:hypothetical protein NDU88_000287 [Pleurodeles waltl]